MIASLASLLREILFFTAYVADSNRSFPQPLSPHEEKKLLEQNYQGDEQARYKLIEHNLRLVAHIAKKYSNSGDSNDDLISIGTIGLIKAVSTFNTNKGTQLATYAARCIENEILMSIRSGKKFKNDVPLHEPVGIDREGNKITLIDILGSDPDEVIDSVTLSIESQALRQCLRKTLGRREALVLELRYGLRGGYSHTQREIAGMMGISRSYVSRIEKRAIQKLAAVLNKGER